MGRLSTRLARYHAVRRKPLNSGHSGRLALTGPSHTQSSLQLTVFGAPWTPEKAREEAVRVLGAVAEGGDPAAERRAVRQAATVAELCDAYLVDAEAGRVLTRTGDAKKASTLAIDKGRVARHIKPLLGGLAVIAVTRDDVEQFCLQERPAPAAGCHAVRSGWQPKPRSGVGSVELSRGGDEQRTR